jgi:putative two-component system response regulator
MTQERAICADNLGELATTKTTRSHYPRHQASSHWRVRMNVVIIDDNMVNVTVLKVLVRQLADCQSIEFTDPKQALDWCWRNEADLIVTDFMMPEMNGLEFFHALREVPGCQNVPVLMITASHETEIRHQALNEGVTDFLTKPVDRAEFLARARNMVALSRAKKAMTDHLEWLAEEVSKATEVVEAREQDTIFRLSKAAEYRDPETGAHVIRMAHYSRLIAQTLQLTAKQCDLLFQAAPMHDIGKGGTPDHILLKPDRLDAHEMAVMREHVTIGHEILRDSSSESLQMASVIALSHHEKFDGSGYPSGLAGEAIPLVGRIVAVADVFDALTSVRPYRDAWSLDEARAYLEDNSGKHFDPQCVAAFLSNWQAVLAIRQACADDPNNPALIAKEPASHHKECL